MTTTIKKAKRQLARRHMTLAEIKVNLDAIDEQKSQIKKSLHSSDKKDRNEYLRRIRELDRERQLLIKCFNTLTGR